MGYGLMVLGTLGSADMTEGTHRPAHLPTTRLALGKMPQGILMTKVNTSV